MPAIDEKDEPDTSEDEEEMNYCRLHDKPKHLALRIHKWTITGVPPLNVRRQLKTVKKASVVKQGIERDKRTKKIKNIRVPIRLTITGGDLPRAQQLLVNKAQ